MIHASFKVVNQTEDDILLFDIGPWNRYPTITNDAEWVVEQMYGYYHISPDTKIYYIDSSGDRSELLHKDRVFAGFN